eukprot:111405-Chlamydomonas_euryale.AAC.1
MAAPTLTPRTLNPKPPPLKHPFHRALAPTGARHQAGDEPQRAPPTLPPLNPKPCEPGTLKPLPSRCACAHAGGAREARGVPRARTPHL